MKSNHKNSDRQKIDACIKIARETRFGDYSTVLETREGEIYSENDVRAGKGSGKGEGNRICSALSLTGTVQIYG